MRQTDRLPLLLLTLLLGWATPAVSQEKADGPPPADWSTTFPADAVNSHVGAEDLQYIVVAAGSGDEATDAAADRLIEALRQGPAAVVMNDDPIGDVTGLNDDEIVDRARVVSFDRIAIVRVFEGGPDKPETAVVTVRNAAGEVLWGVSSPRGKPIAAGEASDEGRGLSARTSKSVSEVSKQAGPSSAEAQRRYIRQFIWFRELLEQNVEGHDHVKLKSANQGKYGRRLEWDEFYQEIGRPDLARRYRARSREFGWGTGLTLLGLAGSVGGGIWWLIQGVSPKQDATTAMWFTIGSGATVIGGFTLLGASGRIHPISAARAMELADKHNRKLKKELGLPADYSPLPGVASPSDVHFRVAIQPGAAGGTLQIRF